MKPNIQLQMGQQLSLAPQLQQAIRLLQLSALELKDEIQQLMESNPMLEYDETPPEPTPKEDMISEPLETAKENVAVSEQEQIDNNNQFSNEVNQFTQAKRTQYDDDYNIDAFVSAKETLQDYLFWQMRLTPFTETEVSVATAIIDGINEDGYLTCDFDEIIEAVREDAEVDETCVLKILKCIQNFDPVGVGARDIQECLLLQLNALPKIDTIEQHALTIVEKHMNLLGRCDYKSLERKCRLSNDELQEVIHLIQSLNPRPGTSIGTPNVNYVVPDVVTFKQDNRWVVRLNSVISPKLALNQQYMSYIKRADSSKDNSFLKDNLKEARWFLKSLENRNSTLLKVATCIVERQHKFLEQGEYYMKPMVLQDVAQVVGLHESTISRITTQKYIHTPRGVFELKYFFSSEVQAGQGQSYSSTAIRAYIKNLIADEDHHKPLSDLKIVQLLQSNHQIKIARRTVTKYREALKIPSSNERRYLESKI